MRKFNSDAVALSLKTGLSSTEGGEKDHTAPLAVAMASYKQQKDNLSITEFHEIPGRGHSLIIDHGWREVAESGRAFSPEAS